MNQHPNRPRIRRHTVDLSDFPDLVVILLGMRVRKPRGILRLLSLGPQIQRSAADNPDGLLLHENVLFSLWPLELGMRQYWRDYDSLETWTRSEPHRQWWQQFLRDSGGTGFWHETYSMRGGIEAIYDDLPAPRGMLHFAPKVQARGAMFSARRRLRRGGESTEAAPVPEESLYDAVPSRSS